MPPLLTEFIEQGTCEKDKTYALKTDGFVVAVGLLFDGLCNVAEWRDITQVSGGISQSVGLKEDSTALAKGYNSSGQCEISLWRDLKQIDAGLFHTLGLKTDGTVVARGPNDNDVFYGSLFVDRN